MRKKNMHEECEEVIKFLVKWKSVLRHAVGMNVDAFKEEDEKVQKFCSEWEDKLMWGIHHFRK